MSTGWQGLSVQLMKQGDMKSLRTLLAQTHLDTGMSYEEVCRPSGYSWVGDVFVRDKAYGLLKSVRKRLKAKRAKENLQRDKENLQQANRKMVSQGRAAASKLASTRACLTELRQTHTNSRNFFLEAQSNYCKIKKRCDLSLKQNEVIRGVSAQLRKKLGIEEMKRLELQQEVDRLSKLVQQLTPIQALYLHQRDMFVRLQRYPHNPDSLHAHP